MQKMAKMGAMKSVAPFGFDVGLYRGDQVKGWCCRPRRVEVGLSAGGAQGEEIEAGGIWCDRGYAGCESSVAGRGRGRSRARAPREAQGSTPRGDALPAARREEVHAV